ncbi:MAG: hypothetical protein IJ130_14070 [Solobacterium sp.]|nr:hypothetical protein [Solobacterium sp.]
MKILLAPGYSFPADTSAFIAARDVQDLLETKGRETAVCTPLPGFRNAIRFDAPAPSRKKLFVSDMIPPATYEETMYLRGALDSSFLKKDIAAIRDAIRTYHPDLLFEFSRPAAAIAARLENIPYVSYVPYGSTKDIPFPAKCLKDVNNVLSSLHLEQILRLSDLCVPAASRIGFSPAFLYRQPRGVTPLGSLCHHRKRRDPDSHVCIFPGALPAKTASALIDDCFLGAPYDVFGWYSDAQPSARDHLRISSVPRTEMLAGASVCIHDGCDALFSRCIYLGIPQIIISDGSWERARNASSLIHCGCGLVLNEETVTMADVYEAFRKVVTNDAYRKKAEHIADALLDDPDLTDIMKRF